MKNLLEHYNKINNFGRLLNMTFEVISPGNVIHKLTISADLLATTSAAHGGHWQHLWMQLLV